MAISKYRNQILTLIHDVVRNSDNIDKSVILVALNVAKKDNLSQEDVYKIDGLFLGCGMDMIPNLEK